MSALIYALSVLSSFGTTDVPAGTQLHIRLTSTVGSYASRPGSPVQAVLIAPVTVSGAAVFPANSVLSGVVKTVRRVGYGVVHESAAIELRFDRLTLPDGQELPVSARVVQVDNGRERVNRKGVIERERSTGTLTYRGCGYIKTALMWNFNADLAFWAIKTLVVQVPEPEIYFPPGVELTLSSTAPVRVEVAFDTPADVGPERADVDAMVASMPKRTLSASTSAPSDLINLGFVGSREQLTTAFAAAGWTEAHPVSFRSKALGFKAVAEGMGYLSAPMSAQLVNDIEANISLQKGLNDVSKRHHIRVWKYSADWHGQEVWVGAATRDVDFAYLRPGGRFTHRIEENIDQEREKIVYDLAFTSCVERADWIDRPGFRRSARNATGDLMTTDGRLALVRLNGCSDPKLTTETSELNPVAKHGTGLQRFARREVLSMRNDLFRANPYFRTYEGIRALVNVYKRTWPLLDAKKVDARNRAILRAST